MIILIFLCIRVISAQSYDKPINDGFIDFSPYYHHSPSPHTLKHALHNMNDILPHSQYVNKKYYVNDDQHYQEGNWEISNKYYSHNQGAKHPNMKSKLHKNSKQYYHGPKPSNMNNKYYPGYNQYYQGVKPQYANNKHYLGSKNQEDNHSNNNQYYQEDNLSPNNQNNQVANPSNDNIRNEVEYNDQEISPLDNTSDLQMGLDPKITAMIKKLTDVLKVLNNILIRQTKITQIRRLKKANLMQLQEKNHALRNKRDIGEVTETTEAVTDSAQEKNETLENETTENSTDVVPASSDCNGTFHSRRTFSEDLEVSSTVKSRLLSYINEFFSDIENKINSLHNVKNALAADNEYNIGYMIANIDMLEINLKNMKIEMEESRQYLGERHLLDMFDKVKVSNNLVTGLLEALKNILDKKVKAEEQNYFNTQ